MLYEADIKGVLISEFLKELPVAPDDFVAELVNGVAQNLESIDAEISKFSKEWPLERMPLIDKAVLRLAIYELKHTDTPKAVVMDEAVEISKDYSTENSGRFINGVLAAVADAI